jgi:N6-adenosine-specific RNA methylase IME4
MTPLPFHRFANIFPLIEGEELRDLAEDIRVQGVLKPIDILEGAVLDGRNRYNALQLLLESGAPRGAGWGAYEGQPLAEEDFDVAAGLPWFKKFIPAEQGDPLDYVWSLNFRRRQLTASQRAACAAEFEGFKQGRPRAVAPEDKAANLPVFDEPGAPAASLGPKTQAERAAMAGVSERVVRDADKVHERSPELHEAVKAGEVTADVAAALVEKPAPEVKQLLDALPRDETGKLTAEAKKELRAVAKEVRADDQAQKRERREQRERAQGQMQLASPNKYGAILADPEWRFDPYSRETGMDRAVDNHYETSPADDIMARRALIDEIAAGDSVLGLWTTQDHLATAMKVMEAWGFTYKSCRTWVTDVVEYPIDPATLAALKFPAGRYLRVCGAPGPGFWGRSRAQFMLIGTRGNPACPAQGLQGESVWFAARPHIEGTNRDLNSAKPEETAHDWFDTHFPSYRKVELNARAARDGWDRWGLEAPRGEGWIGPVPAGAEATSADTQDPVDVIDDDSDLPALPWAAGDEVAAPLSIEDEREALAQIDAMGGAAREGAALILARRGLVHAGLQTLRLTNLGRDRLATLNTAASGSQPAVAASEELYRTPQGVIDAIVARGGHTVHMENDFENGGYRARCDCGWMVRRENSLAGHNETERQVEAHWREVLGADGARADELARAEAPQ